MAAQALYNRDIVARLMHQIMPPFTGGEKMDIEDAFLAAIREATVDRAPRLIYADWLEERGDPRGELIRIEEEMRLLPVFSDRYWQLKLRRNELRPLADREWLQTMRYGTDCLPLFRHGVPDGWKERWRLIREFTERWQHQSLGDVGGRTEEIHAVEDRLGRTLPPSVREWVAFAHDFRISPDYKGPPSPLNCTMKEIDGLSAVSLAHRGENCHWAVRHADLALPDPPVHRLEREYDSFDANPDANHGGYYELDYETQDEKPFVPDARNPTPYTVTVFALEYTMRLTWGSGGPFSSIAQEPAQLLRDLEATFPVRSRFGIYEIFEDENMMIRLRTAPLPWFDFYKAKPLPWEAIPAFLWEKMTRKRGDYGGKARITGMPRRS
jgi:uncharacterized protein (TIGR02996 family)